MALAALLLSWHSRLCTQWLPHPRTYLLLLTYVQVPAWTSNWWDANTAIVRIIWTKETLSLLMRSVLHF